MVEAWLWSSSGCHPPHKTGPVPRRLRILAKADSVGMGRAELALDKQHLVMSFKGRGDDMEEDSLATHRLLENVLGSGGDTEKVKESSEVMQTEVN